MLVLAVVVPVMAVLAIRFIAAVLSAVAVAVLGVVALGRFCIVVMIVMTVALTLVFMAVAAMPLESWRSFRIPPESPRRSRSLPDPTPADAGA